MITIWPTPIRRSASFSRALLLREIFQDADAGEIGHFVPGQWSIRDFVVPEPSFYALAYNHAYTTDRFQEQSLAVSFAINR